MSDSNLWIAEIGPDEELSSRLYDGFQDDGSEGTKRTTYGETYFAIRTTREAAESRVREKWERRVKE